MVRITILYFQLLDPDSQIIPAFQRNRKNAVSKKSTLNPLKEFNPKNRKVKNELWTICVKCCTNWVLFLEKKEDVSRSVLKNGAMSWAKKMNKHNLMTSVLCDESVSSVLIVSKMTRIQ